MRTFMAAVVLYVLTLTDAIADNLVIGVETTQYYPQYQYKNGEYIGYARDVLDLFAKNSGHTFSYKALPIKRLIEAYIDGEVDLKYPDNAFWSADAKAGKNITYSEPVVQYIDGTLVLPANMGKGVTSMKRLGTIRGFTPFDYFPQIKAGSINVTENNNLDSLLKQLENQRIDGAYFNVAVAYYHLRNVAKTPDAAIFDASLPHTKSAYAISSINRPDIVKQFNQFLTSHAKEIAALKAKYQVEQGVE
jgi:polar amino acid transport system substrate-binding protein